MKKKQSEHHLLSANRRDFFRKVLLKSLDHAQSAGQAMVQRTTRLLEPAQKSTPNRANIAQTKPNLPKKRPDNWLRPPGALPENIFLKTCQSCQECVKVCPAKCISIDLSSDNPIASGKPYVQPRRLPCVMCEDLACMQSCPSGALELVDLVTDIKMGLAVVDHKLCFRPPPPEAPEAPEAPEPPEVSPGDVDFLQKKHKPADEPSESAGPSPDHSEVDIAMDEVSSSQRDCQACVSQCPVGDTALSINDAGLIQVHEKGCTGCGVCEWVCPTTPAAIVIKPISISV